MENKYYLNENGLIELIKSTSRKIRENTTKEITTHTVSETLNGLQVDVVRAVNPNKLPTSDAVVQYLRGHNRLTVNQQNATTSLDGSTYSVSSNSHTYAGDEDKTLEIRLITAVDIDGLFPQQ